MTSRSALLLAALAMSLGGCSALEHFNQPPRMSAPGAPPHPLPSPGADRRILAAPPAQASDNIHSASLWREGPEGLFGDRRARKLGDIVTVVVEIDEEAQLRNKTQRDRSSSDDISASALLGLENIAAKALPGGAALDPAISAGSSASSTGDGVIQRQEQITLRVAATVSDVLPNGQLVIQGSQEVRVNYELRELLVAGIIRPEDIARTTR